MAAATGMPNSVASPPAGDEREWCKDILRSSPGWHRPDPHGASDCGPGLEKREINCWLHGFGYVEKCYDLRDCQFFDEHGDAMILDSDDSSNQYLYKIDFSQTETEYYTETLPLTAGAAPDYIVRDSSKLCRRGASLHHRVDDSGVWQSDSLGTHETAPSDSLGSGHGPAPGHRQHAMQTDSAGTERNEPTAELDHLGRSRDLFFDVDVVVGHLEHATKVRQGGLLFLFFLIGVCLQFAQWHALANPAGARQVEAGLRNRVQSIQFEVTPGPHFSQSIRATSLHKVSSTGDLYDWLGAAAEVLAEDNQLSYTTPHDRAPLLAEAVRVLHDPTFAAQWQSVHIDPPSINSTQHQATDESMPALDNCSLVRRNASQCHAAAGCCLWKELWRSKCISCDSIKSANLTGRRPVQALTGRARLDGESPGPGASINRQNRVLPWLLLKSQRRLQLPEQCRPLDFFVPTPADKGCFANLEFRGKDREDRRARAGHTTGAIYRYTFDDEAHTRGSFKWLVRLEADMVETNIGLLEMLRADRWIDEQTSLVSLSGLSWNQHLHLLAHWEVSWRLSQGGLISRPHIVTHSANVDYAAHSTRGSGENWLLFFCIAYQVLLVMNRANHCMHAIKEHIDGNSQRRGARKAVLIFTCYLCFHCWYLWFQIDILWHNPTQQGVFDTVSDLRLLDAVRGVEVIGTVQQTQELTEWLRGFDDMRNIHGILCLVSSVELFSHMHVDRRISILYNTLMASHQSLIIFGRSVGIAMLLWTYASYLTFSRRDWNFRDYLPAIATFWGPAAGGNSYLEDSILEPGGSITRDILAVVLYITYVTCIILLVFNVLIAILVDGYEDAKDKLEKQMSFYQKKKMRINRMTDLMDSFITVPISIPRSLDHHKVCVQIPDWLYAHSVYHDKIGFQAELLPWNTNRANPNIRSGQLVFITLTEAKDGEPANFGWKDAFDVHVVGSAKSILLSSHPEVMHRVQAQQTTCDGKNDCNAVPEVEQSSHQHPIDEVDRELSSLIPYGASHQHQQSCHSACSSSFFRKFVSFRDKVWTAATKQKRRCIDRLCKRKLDRHEQWSRQACKMIDETCTSYARLRLAKILANQDSGSVGSRIFRRRMLLKLASYLRNGQLEKLKRKVIHHEELLEQNVRQARARHAQRDYEKFEAQRKIVANMIRYAEKKLYHREFCHLLLDKQIPLVLLEELWNTFATDEDEDEELDDSGGNATWKQMQQLSETVDELLERVQEFKHDPADAQNRTKHIVEKIISTLKSNVPDQVAAGTGGTEVSSVRLDFPNSSDVDTAGSTDHGNDKSDSNLQDLEPEKET